MSTAVAPDTMNPAAPANGLTPRERELAAIINAYNQVTEQLKQSHETLGREVVRLHEELAGKNRELRRREQLAALGELAAGVAHEIRNPLGGIQLFASLLAKDLQDRPDCQRVVGKIIKGVGTLESIVTDILEFGRPPEAVPARVDVANLLAETVELARPRMADGEVEVAIEVDQPGCEAITDGAMLQRAMLNLLFNAIDAAGTNQSGGRVALRVREAGADQLLIEITDNGPGMSNEDLDRIFNPFFTTKDTGTGLGLSIVHQIAETLGGSVRADNAADGGAVFTLRLPRTMKTSPSGPSEKAPTGMGM